MTATNTLSNQSWDEHYRDERDAGFLYRALSDLEHDSKRRDLFTRLAEVEDTSPDGWIYLKNTGGYYRHGHPLGEPED